MKSLRFGWGSGGEGSQPGCSGAPGPPHTEPDSTCVSVLAAKLPPELLYPPPRTSPSWEMMELRWQKPSSAVHGYPFVPALQPQFAEFKLGTRVANTVSHLQVTCEREGD